VTTLPDAIALPLNTEKVIGVRFALEVAFSVTGTPTTAFDTGLMVMVWLSSEIPPPPPVPVPPPPLTGTVPMLKVKVPTPLPAAFAAPIVTTELPATRGVPEITPVLELSDIPAGSVPETIVKLVGLLVANIGYGERSTLMVPEIVAEVTTGTALVVVAGLTVMVRLPVPVPVAFVALSVDVMVPAVVGVPVIAPVVGLIARPVFVRPVAL
jgi:hypothetical protein